MFFKNILTKTSHDYCYHFKIYYFYLNNKIQKNIKTKWALSITIADPPTSSIYKHFV